ncbi:MAG: creatininase family protein [Spirochaetales bacterium]|nr:creatininase family protein [Spirochaetales bacterium]
MDEVRYHMLRPGQIREKRETCPVAYIPIGTIEWHGLHNPVGADTLQADGLAIRCARDGGGLVFPPLYYGETRVESLMDANAVDREDIAALMGLPPENFIPERIPYTAMEQSYNYERLLVHILAEVMSLGFTLGVLVAGHYPLIDHARAAALRFNKWRPARYGGMLAWACLDYTFVADQYDNAGDHAAGWETSHLMHLHPETVDLSLLPSKGENIVGAGGKMPPQDSTADFGKETLEASASLIVKEVQHRLAHPEMYKSHGSSLKEGLWKDES